MVIVIIGPTRRSHGADPPSPTHGKVPEVPGAGQAPLIMSDLEFNPKLIIDLAVRRLRYPVDVPRTTRVLAGELARRNGSAVEWQSLSITYDSKPEAIEVTGRICGSDEMVKTAGGTVDAAHCDAAFFRLRQALVGEQPVCGVLLDDGDGTRVDLEPSREKDGFQLTLRLDPVAPPRRSPREPASSRPTGIFVFNVRLEAPRGRTRYVIVDRPAQYPELKHYLRSRLRLHTVRLHSLVLALAGEDMRSYRRDGKDVFVHGHHVNGIGFDCRISNLRRLEGRRHREQHVSFSPVPGVILLPEHAQAPEFESPSVTVTVTGDHEPAHAEITRAVRPHKGQKADRSPPALIGAMAASRRDRRRSLDRVIIAILVAGGELSMNALVHALSGSPCKSKSGVRKVVRAAEELKVIEVFRRGRAMHVRLAVRLTRVFRIVRRLLDRVTVIRHLRIIVRLRKTSTYVRPDVPPATRRDMLLLGLRRVLVLRMNH